MFYLYIVIIFLCLLASLYNKVARQRFLWLYFTFVLCSEILIFSDILSKDFYSKANCVHIILMCYFFLAEFTKKVYKISLVLLCIASLCALADQNVLKINIDIFKTFVFIFLSITWFVNQIKDPNEVLIYKKMTFWVSFSILLWSTIFIIRVIPAHFFSELDPIFLQVINNIYQTTTIVSYLIFLRGLFCKQ